MTPSCSSHSAPSDPGVPRHRPGWCQVWGVSPLKQLYPDILPESPCVTTLHDCGLVFYFSPWSATNPSNSPFISTKHLNKMKKHRRYHWSFPCHTNKTSSSGWPVRQSALGKQVQATGCWALPECRLPPAPVLGGPCDSPTLAQQV